MPIHVPLRARTLMAALSLAAGVTGCGGGGGQAGSGAEAISPPPPPDSVSVFRPLGSLQCMGGGLTLASLVQQLASAGITAGSASCGVDGLVRTALCGAADGRIGIVDVPQTQAAAAKALGFALLSDLPSATRVPCP